MDNISHKKANKFTHKRLIQSCLIIAVAVIAFVGLHALTISPFRTVGGVVWLKDGPHYIGNVQVDARIAQIKALKEEALLDKIKSETPTCDSVENGYCQKTSGVFVIKTLTVPAVAYKPAVPDRKEVIGYCTWCNDQSWSPSCAVGRGACSYHGGVAAYNVPKYRIIPGTPAVQAQPAVYGYATKSYKDSTSYAKPEMPSLASVVKF